jgi:signal-transduction protein with cAMP-binding, CBS, and nucleotidyltransferase domain
MIARNILALKRARPFDRLRDSELTLIADVARERTYRPGETVVAGVSPLQNLIVVVEGAIRGPGGQPLPAVFGVESLLFDKPVNGPLSADGETGARCLLISRAHFFTMVNECPALAVGFVDDFVGPGAAGVMEQAP